MNPDNPGNAEIPGNPEIPESSEFAEQERKAAETLIELAFAEDLDERGDLTSQSIIDHARRGQVALKARQTGVVAGLPVVDLVFGKLDLEAQVDVRACDGSTVHPGQVVATVAGPVCTLLAGERTSLNFLTHLSGVATATRRYVNAVAGTRADILDTRKTLPGWRVLEKYAVRVGGGINHRMGLYDEVLIKDNHLAGWSEFRPGATVADAVQEARSCADADIPIGVEVETLAELVDALRANPDMILLDNMGCMLLRRAVALRDQMAPQVKLEASGNVTLNNVSEIAATGVERISIGSLTHSAVALDLAFDWHSATV